MLTEAPVGSSLPGLSRRLSEGVASLEGASRDCELRHGELTAQQGGGVIIYIFLIFYFFLQ